MTDEHADTLQPSRSTLPGIDLDWSGCPEVEQIPGKVSGAPILKGTRCTADAVLVNFEPGVTPEDIAEMFELDVQQVRAVLDYALSHRGTAREDSARPQPASAPEALPSRT